MPLPANQSNAHMHTAQKHSAADNLQTKLSNFYNCPTLPHCHGCLDGVGALVVTRSCKPPAAARMHVSAIYSGVVLLYAALR